MAHGAEPLLRLRGFNLARATSSGERVILQGIDLDLWPGRWTCLLGANGSGKSSLLKFLASEDSPVADRVAILLQDPDDQIIAGTVRRELTLGRPQVDPAPLLEEFGLDGLADLDPRLLSAGQKQRLALAVATGGPQDVLLCDEPTALQDGGQAAWVLDRLERWRAQTGGALVTATCDRREAARADWLVILQEGSVLAQGPAAEVLATKAAGRLLQTQEPPPGGTPPAGTPPGVTGRAEPGAGFPALELRQVGCRFGGPFPGFGGLDLTVGPGQRIGLCGPNGCGKTTLLAVCAGARRPDAGQVRLGGRLLYRNKGLDLDHGRSLLAPQFPEYFFCRSTVAQEMALDPCLAGTDPGRFLEELGLPADLARSNPCDLSSGQRRRLAVALVVRSGRPLLLLDEPTAAQDSFGRSLILDLLAAVPAEAALVIASHDGDFLARAGCRILTLTPRGLAA